MVGPFSGVARITVLLARVFHLNKKMVGPGSSRLLVVRDPYLSGPAGFLLPFQRNSFAPRRFPPALGSSAWSKSIRVSLHSKKTDDRINILMSEKAIFILCIYARNTSVNEG